MTHTPEATTQSGWNQICAATDGLIAAHGMNTFGSRRTAAMVAAALHPEIDFRDGAPASVGMDHFKPHAHDAARIAGIVRTLQTAKPTSAVSDLDTLVRAHQAKHGGTYEQALAAVTNTEAGRRALESYGNTF